MHRPALLSIAYAVYFLSGVASLVCQVVWFKQLQRVLSSSTFAVSVVVASFFAGLALGSWLLGRLSDRLSRPDRAYAVLELLLAATSLLVTLGLSSGSGGLTTLVGRWLDPAHPAAPLAATGLALLVLLPPTTLMGATLPVLSRFLVSERAQLGQRLGTLYALNTLGAAAGAVLVGFVLIERLGVSRAGFCASLLYAAIGVTAALVFRPRQAGPPVAREEDASPASSLAASSLAAGSAPPREPLEEPRPATGGSPHRARLLMAVFGLSGFAAIAYEVVWFRVLAQSAYPTVYAFSAMLATYLVGLVLGTLLCTRYLTPRREQHLRLFAEIQLLMALAGIISLGLLGLCPPLTQALQGFLGRGELSGWLTSGQRNTLTLNVVVLVTLLGPVTVIGLSFPLATELTIDRMAVLGSRLGSLYALNTLGGLLGALTAGFVLVPLLGSQGSLLAIAALNAGLFLVVALGHAELRPRGPLLRRAALVAGAAGLLLATLGPRYLQRAQTNIDGARTLAFRESAHGTFAVLEHQVSHTAPIRQLVVNGTSYAGMALHGRRYHAALGHFPALLHPAPRTALVICVGTGTTVGALTLHPEIERVDAVDISPDIFALAPLFEGANQGFHRSPKVRPIVADGRHVLQVRETRYDLMTFEPPPPLAAGVVNLYSLEFYQLAQRRLRPGGVLAQWFPLNHGSAEVVRMNLHSLTAAFSHVSLFVTNDLEAVAVASMSPIRIDPQLLARRMAHAPLRADLAEYGLGLPEQLLGTFVAADAALRAFIGEVPLVTDDRPRIEYHGPYEGAPLRFPALLAHREPVERYFAAPVSDPARLELERRIMDRVWGAYEARAAKQPERSRQLLLEATRLDPTNAYLRYELARQDALAALPAGH